MERYGDIFKAISEFAAAHSEDDTDRLLLKASGIQDIDMRMAVNTILGKRKMKSKVPSWAGKDIVIPNSLNTEQCSSERCASYKAEVIRSLGAETVADLTGGLGVDSFFMAKVCREVFYFERDETVAAAAGFNFGRLGAGNIRVSNLEISSRNIIEVLEGCRPDIIYIDPARRGKSGERVFALSDYEPDIFGILDRLFEYCRYVIVKISPMEDIDAIFSSIPQCREIHTVSVDNECKELLLILDRDCTVPAEDRRRTAAALNKGTDYIISFSKNEETAFSPTMIMSADELHPGSILADPNRAILKSGGYSIFAKAASASKLDRSTHIYLVKDTIPGAARYFRILMVGKFDKKSVSSIVSACGGSAEVTAKNIPMTSDALRKKLKIKAGGPCHIWGCRVAGENILLLTEKLS